MSARARGCRRFRIGCRAGRSIDRGPARFCGNLRGRRRRSIGGFQFQSDAPKMQSMRIVAQPVEKFFLAGFGCRITHRPAIRVEHLVTELRRVEPARHRDRVPCPMRGCAEWEIFVIGIEKRLEAGDIGAECELAVADRERGKRIDFSDDGIMPANDGLPIECWTRPAMQIGRRQRVDPR